MVLGRANAWSENADPEGRQVTERSVFPKETKMRGPDRRVAAKCPRGHRVRFP